MLPTDTFCLLTFFLSPVFQSWMKWTSWTARPKTFSTPSLSGRTCPSPASVSSVRAPQYTVLNNIHRLWYTRFIGRYNFQLIYKNLSEDFTLKLHTYVYPFLYLNSIHSTLIAISSYGLPLVLLYAGRCNECRAILGIANALDLTDRILPRLQALPRCRPQLLHFPPYSRQELAAIVQDRLTQVSGEGLLDASAVQFCARKVSAVSGDARKALDICR